MSTLIKFEATIYELVEVQLNHSERMELIEFILFELCSDSQFNIFLKTLMENMIYTEKEFDNNKERIKAYQNIIKIIKEKKEKVKLPF